VCAPFTILAYLGKWHAQMNTVSAAEFASYWGANAVETAKMLHVAFQGQTVDRTQPLNGFSKFKSGKNSTENSICSGQLSTNKKITL